MRYQFFTCDVFTTTRFGGNPLAVLPDAEGLTTKQMQAIAREFNYSETSFVLPAKSGNTRAVRIFTPTREIPFAGHPNIGTAFVLAENGYLGEIDTGTKIAFEEIAGIVPITLSQTPGEPMECELVAPGKFEIGPAVPADLVARALSISTDQIRTTIHAPLVASVGLPFLLVELTDIHALAQIKADTQVFHEIAALGVMPDIHAYVHHSALGFDIHTRMFAPIDGVPEDPATGSANCALAGLLAHTSPATDLVVTWRIAQGIEMGRPSSLVARAEKTRGEVQIVRIKGASVAVSSGELLV